MSPKTAISLPDGELVHSYFTVSFGILQRTIDFSDHLYNRLFHHITFYSILNLMVTLSDVLSHRIVQQNYLANDMLWGQSCLLLFLVNVAKKGGSYCLDFGQ